MSHLDRLLGLHEELTVIYVVDEYVASLYTEDGITTVMSCKGATVQEALNNLDCELEDWRKE